MTGAGGATRALGYVLAFVALTAPATWWWHHGGFELYARGFGALAGGVYDALGLERAAALPRQRYINWIPFAALVLLTPRLGWRRRWAGLGLGLLALVAAHLLFNALASYGSGRGSYPMLLALVSDALPFALWAAIAREWIAGLVGRGAEVPAAQRTAITDEP